MPELADLLSRGLAELGDPPGPETQRKLLDFASLLESWAPRMNLTGHRDREAILRRLVLDAAALWRALPDTDSVVDLGSGAGIPGLPIAALSPRTRVLLVEARLRRHHFQKAARRELDLQNVRVRRGRMEGLEPEPAGLVVAQAVAPARDVLGWMLPWAQPGGWVAIPGSEEPPDPLSGVPDAEQSVEAAQVVRYRVPLEGPERTVWLARRPTG